MLSFFLVLKDLIKLSKRHRRALKELGEALEVTYTHQQLLQCAELSLIISLREP